MDEVYRQALIAAVYGESATYHVADDPLAKDAANTVRRLREQLFAAIARAEAAEKRADDYQALYEAEQKAVWHAEREQRVQAQLAADCMDARDALAANNARLREALEWYAAPDTWQRGSRITRVGNHHTSAGELDGGRRARAALRAQPGEETSG